MLLWTINYSHLVKLHNTYISTQNRVYAFECWFQRVFVAEAWTNHGDIYFVFAESTTAIKMMECVLVSCSSVCLASVWLAQTLYWSEIESLIASFTIHSFIHIFHESHAVRCWRTWFKWQQMWCSLRLTDHWAMFYLLIFTKQRMYIYKSAKRIMVLRILVCIMREHLDTHVSQISNININIKYALFGLVASGDSFLDQLCTPLVPSSSGYILLAHIHYDTTRFVAFFAHLSITIKGLRSIDQCALATCVDVTRV